MQVQTSTSLARLYPKAKRREKTARNSRCRDKIVRMTIKKILEAIFEQDFMDTSYGFRPNRSCHDALTELDRIIMNAPVNFVVDMDISKFFDTVEHKRLMECLRQSVVDLTLLQMIGRFLKSGIMEEGMYFGAEQGTPQGGVLSPVLANVYLHYALDLWFETEVLPQLTGFAWLVRYADDFVVCFENENEARAFGDELRRQMGGFGLKDI
ncbi:MAG: reverse transcriptase domain-containing protein [Euryarchaeota archaeon]|nr:reverse transcriptase domain-containing protein [Euryarchaeota archaeon]